MDWIKNHLWGTGRTLLGALITVSPELLTAIGHPMPDDAVTYVRGWGSLLLGVGAAGKLNRYAPYIAAFLKTAVKK